MKQLFCDCKTDDEKSAFFLSGRAVETGVIAQAISSDVAMAYHRCSELKKELEVERMRLAACGVAALGYFNGCAKEYESSSLYDVMELRAKNEELRAKIEAMEQQKPVGEIQRANSTGNYICSEVWVPLPVGSKLYALPGAQPAPIEQDTSVRKAWARFSNELHRSPDAPYPGMADAFEQHFSQSFTDREWRAESATWAAAWKAAKRHGAQPAPSVPNDVSMAYHRCAEFQKEIDTLRAKIEAAENDAAHQKALAASALRVAEGWERKCGELRAEVIYWKEQKEPGAAGWRALARILQAKIDAMEKQEPIGGMLEVSPHNYELRWYRPVPFGTKLYTLPGAKGE